MLQGKIALVAGASAHKWGENVLANLVSSGFLKNCCMPKLVHVLGKKAVEYVS